MDERTKRDPLHSDSNRADEFQEDEELTAALLQQSQHRRKLIKRVVAVLLALALFINILSVWPRVLNWTALDFLSTSYRLYQDSQVRERKQAIVSIVGHGRKGTGFVIDPLGLVITNHHVIDELNGLYIHFPNEVSLVPKIERTLPDLDLAILDVEATDLPYVSPDYDYKWRIGERVTFIGNPLGFPLIANEGEIVGETSVKGIKEPVIMIQAPVYQGNSGSPVFNQEGKVIGVIFATIPKSSSQREEIIGLAIPIRYLQDQIELSAK